MCSHQPVTGHALSPGRSSHFGFLQPRALPQLWVVSSDIPRSGGIGVRKSGSPGWQQWYPIPPTSCATRIYFFMILCSRSPFTRASQRTKDSVLQVECLLQVARSCSKIPRVTLWYLLVCAINFTWYLFQMQKPLIQKGLPTWMVRWQGCLCRSLDLPQSPLEASLKAGSFWYHLVNGSEQISKCRIHCLQDPKNPTKHCASFLVGCVCVCVCVCVCTQSLSCVRLFETPWIAASQAPLSIEFSGQNTAVGCHSRLQGIFLIQGSNLHLLWLLHWQADSLSLCNLESPHTTLSLSQVTSWELWHAIMSHLFGGLYSMPHIIGCWNFTSRARLWNFIESTSAL